MSGVMIDLTKLLTSAVKAAPMTTATARSTRLPRRMKARNSLSSPGMPERYLRTRRVPVRVAGVRPARVDDLGVERQERRLHRPVGRRAPRVLVRVVAGL